MHKQALLVMDRIIGVIGVNHKTAPVEVREKLSFSENQNREFIKNLRRLDAVAGAVVLSTCNRTEIYFHIRTLPVGEANELVLAQVLQCKGLSRDIGSHLYILNGICAVNHLFKVASGLNSMVLGEDQIIGQIKNAFLISDHEHCAGPILTRLFNRSFSAGKKVRTETRINEGNASVSSAAVTLAIQHYPDITNRKVLLIGAGQTGRLSLQSLKKRGCDSIFITNRTRLKAEEVARGFRATAIDFRDTGRYIAKCDIIMIATASAAPLIEVKIVREAMKKRRNPPLLIFDLSVPRNVDEDVGNIKDVTLYDVDAIQSVIWKTLDKRRDEIEKAKQITEDLSSGFMEWLASLNLSPTIRRIQDNFHLVNDIEFRNYKRCGIDYDRKPLKDYGNHISDKFSRLLIDKIKLITDNGKKVEHLKILNELFELVAEDKSVRSPGRENKMDINNK